MSELGPNIAGFDRELNRDELFKEIGNLLGRRISDAATLNESFHVKSEAWKFDLEIDQRILTPDNEKPHPSLVITPLSSLETPKTRGIGIAIRNVTEGDTHTDVHTFFGIHKNKKSGSVERITYVDIDPESFFEIGNSGEEDPVDDAANIVENLNLETLFGLTNNDCGKGQLLMLREVLQMARPRVPDFGERLFSMIIEGNFPRIITDF